MRSMVEPEGADADEFMKHMFEYWRKEVVQKQIVRKFRRDFYPRAAIAKQQPIEFEVEPSPKLYLDLNSSRVKVTLRITDPKTNAAIVLADHVGPINLLGQTMWADILVEMGGKLLNETTNGLYPYRAYVETLLSVDDDSKEMYYGVEGWKKDDPAKIAHINVDDGVAGNKNPGLTERMSWFASGTQVEFTFRPHVEIFQQQLLIPSMAAFRMKLYPSRDSFVLNCPTDSAVVVGGVNVPNSSFNLEIVECVFKVETREVTQPLELAHISELVKGNNMRFHVRRVEPRQFTIVPNHQGQTFDPIVSGILPDRILAFFVDQKARDGSYQLNPLNFEHCDVREISLYVNGELNNGQTIKCDFTGPKKQTLEGYLTLYEAMDQLYKDRPVPVVYKDWAHGYTIFGFDITPDGSAGTCPNGIRKGVIGMRIEFRTAPTKPYNLIILSEGEGIYELDQHGEVVIVQ